MTNYMLSEKDLEYIEKYCGLTVDAYSVDPDNDRYTIQNGMVFSKDFKTLYAVPASLTGMLVLPKETQRINNKAFKLSKLEKVIGSGIVYIGYNAFEWSETKNVFFPYLKTVGRQAFLRSLLEKIDLSLVNIIDNGVFSYTKIRNLFLSNHVTSVGAQAFCGCRELISVEVAIGAEIAIGSEAFAECPNLKIFDYLEGILSPESKIFLSCENLEKIIIPEIHGDIPTIYCGCQSLKEIIINGEQKVIGEKI